MFWRPARNDLGRLARDRVPVGRRGGRGQGHATALLAEAEAFAIGKGCTGALLDTHNPAARRLYERLGYTLFATLEDYPPGWAKFFLRKQLAWPSVAPI